MVLNDGNYYSLAANREYMSVSQYKEFAGTYGKIGCEFMAMEKLVGRWEDEPSTAMMVGSYIVVRQIITGHDEQIKSPPCSKGTAA